MHLFLSLGFSSFFVVHALAPLAYSSKGLIFVVYVVKPTSSGKKDFLHSLRKNSRLFAFFVISSTCVFYFKSFWTHTPRSLNVFTLSNSVSPTLTGGGSELD